jgi:hypothetical protein
MIHQPYILLLIICKIILNSIIGNLGQVYTVFCIDLVGFSWPNSCRQQRGVASKHNKTKDFNPFTEIRKTKREP